jgi:hypothetical protein
MKGIIKRDLFIRGVSEPFMKKGDEITMSEIRAIGRGVTGYTAHSPAKLNGLQLSKDQVNVVKND